MFQRIRTMNH